MPQTGAAHARLHLKIDFSLRQRYKMSPVIAMESIIAGQVLVLNRLWQAVNVCSVSRAFTLLYQGHATAVDAETGTYQTLDFHQWVDRSRDYDGGDCVHTVSLKIKVPKVILLHIFDRLPRKEIKLTRQSIFERDNYTCQYCKETPDRRQLNLDHIIPRERGGQTTWENIVCSCIPCNSKKGNRTPHEAGMRLLKKPQRPKWRPMLVLYRNRVPHESWRHFLDLDSWHVELSD